MSSMSNSQWNQLMSPTTINNRDENLPCLRRLPGFDVFVCVDRLLLKKADGFRLKFKERVEYSYNIKIFKQICIHKINMLFLYSINNRSEVKWSRVYMNGYIMC